MDGLDREAAQLDLLAGADLVEDGARRKAVLLQLIFDKANCQPCGVDRHIEFFEQIRQAADVILVPVGDEQTLDAVFVFQHIGEIRDDKVNAEHVCVREDEAAVDEDHIALTFVQRDIFADLAEAAQRADVHRDGRGHLKMLLLLGLAAAALRPGCSVLCRGLHSGLLCRMALARAARTRCGDALRGGRRLLCGSGRARLAGARLVLRARGVLALRAGCARTALLRGALRIGGTTFTFWLELFHRKPPNHRISGLIPANCGYRTPSKTVAIYVFFRANAPMPMGWARKARLKRRGQAR